MNLRQLTYLCAIIDCNFSISNAAQAVCTSQPNVSRQIQLLERELGIRILARSRQRVIGLTKAGQEVSRVAKEVIRKSGELRQIGLDYSGRARGRLTIAASHSHARYSLPSVITRFMREYPDVRFALRQGDPALIAQWIAAGEADVSISPEPVMPVPGVTFLHCAKLQRIVLTPLRHPLLNASPLTLEELVRYPLITYNSGFTAHSNVVKAFQNRGLQPDVVLSASNVDVMKTYVQRGLGVAISATIAFNPEDEGTFACIDAKHLFAPSDVCVGLRRGNVPPAYVYDFIKLFAPALKRTRIDRAIAS